MTRILFFLTLTVLSFSSCTVSKRLHRPGLHIEWKRSNKQDVTAKVIYNKGYSSQNSNDTENLIEKINNDSFEESSQSSLSENTITAHELGSKNETINRSSLSAESLTNTYASHVYNNDKNAEEISDSYPSIEKKSKPPFKTALILACIGVLLIVLAGIFIETLYFLYVFPVGAGLILLLIALIYLIIGLAS